MPPRFHNTLSYSVTIVVFAALVPWSRAAPLVAFAFWGVHFLRRTLESLFVHRYSGRLVPARDYLVEYLYYWGFAAWIAVQLNDPAWALPKAPWLAMATLVFVLGEIGNTWAHRKLRALRPASGQSVKSIPQGGMFAWISCPHYFFEIVSWVGFAMLTRVLASYAFLTLGAIILTSYAVERHRAYQREFNGKDGRELYPADRRAIFFKIL